VCVCERERERERERKRVRERERGRERVGHESVGSPLPLSRTLLLYGGFKLLVY
jgi:hypothetical protein